MKERVREREMVYTIVSIFELGLLARLLVCLFDIQYWGYTKNRLHTGENVGLYT